VSESIDKYQLLSFVEGGLQRHLQLLVEAGLLRELGAQAGDLFLLSCRELLLIVDAAGRLLDLCVELSLPRLEFGDIPSIDLRRLKSNLF